MNAPFMIPNLSFFHLSAIFCLFFFSLYECWMKLIQRSRLQWPAHLTGSISTRSHKLCVLGRNVLQRPQVVGVPFSSLIHRVDRWIGRQVSVRPGLWLLEDELVSRRCPCDIHTRAGVICRPAVAQGFGACCAIRVVRAFVQVIRRQLVSHGVDGAQLAVAAEDVGNVHRNHHWRPCVGISIAGGGIVVVGDVVEEDAVFVGIDTLAAQSESEGCAGVADGLLEDDGVPSGVQCRLQPGGEVARLAPAGASLDPSVGVLRRWADEAGVTKDRGDRQKQQGNGSNHFVSFFAGDD